VVEDRGYNFVKRFSKAVRWSECGAAYTVYRQHNWTAYRRAATFRLGPLLVGLYGNYYGHRFSSSRFIDGTFDCIDSAVSHLLFKASVTAAAGSSFGGINHYFFASLDPCSAQLAGSRELRESRLTRQNVTGNSPPTSPQVLSPSPPGRTQICASPVPE
jgi:hypothetical protein